MVWGIYHKIAADDHYGSDNSRMHLCKDSVMPHSKKNDYLQSKFFELDSLFAGVMSASAREMHPVARKAIDGADSIGGYPPAESTKRPC